jgi:5-hydroxyisourate hydrolase-like protein (transthyretin family)
MQRFAKIAGALALVLLTTIVGSSLLAFQSATVNISPPSGPQDARFVIEMRDLAPDTTYTVDFIYEPSGAAIFRTEATSDADGRALLSIRTEPSDPPGVYLVQVLDAGGNVVGEGQFSVVADDTPEQDPSTEQDIPTEGAANVQIVPRSALVGSVYNILVSGLDGGAGVVVEITDPDGDTVYNRLRTADNSGRFQVEIFTQRGDTAGEYSVRLQDRDGNTLGGGSFTVEELSGRMGAVSIIPQSGPAGTTYTIRATDLRDFVNVQVRITNTDTGDLVTILSARTNVDGTVELDYSSEDDLAAGGYTVTIEEAGDAVAQGMFSVDEPPAPASSVTITPALGLPGDQFTFDVSGLEPGSEFTFSIVQGGETVFTTENSADSEGNFSLTLGTGTGDALGAYRIQVTQAGAVIAANTLTLVATLPRDVVVNIAPEAGTAGDTFIITAGGLQAAETVTFEIARDDTVVFSEQRTADVNGAVAFTYISDADSQPGEYSVRVLATPEAAAEDAAAEVIGTTTLVFLDTSVQPVVQIAPASAPAGTTRIITATGFAVGEVITVEVLLDGEVVYTEDETADVNGSIALNLPGVDASQPGEYSVRVLRDGELQAEGGLIAEGEIPTDTAQTEEEEDAAEDADPEQDTEAQDQATTSDVAITIEPASGPIGTNYEINAAGLEAGEAVVINVTIDGEVIFSTERTASAAGRVQLFIASEAGDPLGRYGVQVVRDGEVVAQTDFVVGDPDPDSDPDNVVDEPEQPEQDQAPEAGEIVLLIEPEAGERGTIHIITVSGLEAGESITLTMTRDGQTVYESQQNANGNGIVRVNLQSEASDTAGAYNVTVTRGDDETIAEATLTVQADDVPQDVVDEPETDDAEEPETDAQAAETAVNVSIQPPSGPVGTSHEVSISGLDAGETVTLDVLFAGAVDFTTERTADANGEITIRLVAAEGDPIGVYTVNVVRGDNVIASEDLTVQAPDTDEPDVVQPPETPETDAPEAAQGDIDLYAGSLTAQDPFLRYNFSGAAGEAVYITLESADFDTLLLLQDDTGTELQRNDDIGQTLNSAIGPFVLPYTGRYTVVVESFQYSQMGEIAAGDFELAIERVTLASVVYDEPASIRFDDSTNSRFFSFDAELGDIIDIDVQSADAVDTTLALTGPEGFEIAFDDDSGAGFNPEINRYIVQEPGTYLMALRTFTEGDTGNVQVTVERQEARSISSGAQLVRLNGKQSQDILRLEAEAGQSVRMTVSVVSGNAEDMLITASQDVETLMTYSSKGIPEEITLGFIVPQAGTVGILVEDQGLSSTILEFELIED